MGAQYQLQSFDRRTDGTSVGGRRIPRLKVEYQLTRAIFFRVVGEYDASRQDDLRDDGRTELPIVIRDPATGALRARAGDRSATASAWTGCSPTSRRRGRWSSRATAAR